MSEGAVKERRRASRGMGCSPAGCSKPSRVVHRGVSSTPQNGVRSSGPSNSSLATGSGDAVELREWLRDERGQRWVMVCVAEGEEERTLQLAVALGGALIEILSV